MHLKNIFRHETNFIYINKNILSNTKIIYFVKHLKSTNLIILTFFNKKYFAYIKTFCKFATLNKVQTNN